MLAVCGGEKNSIRCMTWASSGGFPVFSGPLLSGSRHKSLLRTCLISSLIIHLLFALLVVDVLAAQLVLRGSCTW